jgi:geranylgeranylglycerol-phosphate geranylgeranyltransferase
MTMGQIKGLYRISRPLTTLTGALAVVLGGYVANTGEWLMVAFAVVATILVSSSANAWNDYLDVEIDRVNQPHRPLPSGQVKPENVRLFSFVLAGLSLAVAALISWQALLIALVSNLLLFLYSWRLKSTVLLGNVVIATVSAMSAVFGGVAAGNPRPSLWLFVIIFVSILGREVLKTLADYDGDLKESVRTISTAWGKRAARIAFYLLALATLVMMLLPVVLQIYRPIYGLIVALGVFPVFVYILLHVSRYRSGPQLERLSQLMKYDFLVWFVAVVLGAW